MRHETTDHRRPADDDSVRRYVRRWVAIGLLGTLAAAAATPIEDLLATPWWLILGLIALTAVSEGTELIIHHQRTDESITLLEVAVVVDLMLLPPLTAVLVAVAGIGLVHLLRQRGSRKILFNLAIHGSATAVAALFLTLVPNDPIFSPTRAVAVLVAMALFALVNFLSLGGLFARLENERLGTILSKRGRFVVANVLGNSVVGLLAVALGTAYPWLVPLLVTPIGALHLTYRGVARAESLLSEVQAERDRLNRVIAGASDGIVLLDDQGRVLVWNRAMQRITGYPSSAVEGRDARAVLSARDATGAQVDPTMPLATIGPGQDPTWTVEVQITRADGRPVDVRTVHTVLFDDRGHATGDVMLVHDLSREREVQSLKEDFVARVSHELRTPLTPIRGYAHILLSRGGSLTPEQREDALLRILERTQHLARLVDDLLLAARVSSNDPRAIGEVMPEPTDMTEVAADVVRWFQRDLPSRSFRLEAEENVPPAHADPMRARQILTNLLSNACKYSGEDDEVLVAVRRDGARVAVEVVDQGEGIRTEDLDAIFERFHRLEPPDRMRTSGIGLGLYIARRLAEAMDGTIEVDSEVGRGSTFRLLLRVAATEPDHDPPGSEPTPIRVS